MSRYYLVYDGRAMNDTDDALVMLAIGKKRDASAAIKEAKSFFSGEEWALFSYREEGNKLLDEQFEYYGQAGKK